MNSRLSLTLLSGATLITPFVNAQKQKPNVIYILCDDLGYGEVGYNGQEKIKTPNLDRLVENGLKFNAHYCGSAVSAPSRCVLMTGQHTGHAYIRANSPRFPDCQVPIPEDSETVAKLMKRAGYTTACIGKWGLGCFHNSGNPNKQGFDHFYGYTDQVQAHNYYPKYLWRNGKKIAYNQNNPREHYTHDLFTRDAISFITENKEEPFFLYLAYTIPHTAYQVPDLGAYKDKDWPENMKIHAAMTSRMDGDVGKLVDLLEELDIDKNTLIFFSSDNGAHGQFKSEQFFNTSGDLRGVKRSMYEGGLRSPSFAYWPGTVPAGEESDHISAFWDLLPTLSELTGEKMQGPTDGISMLPTLIGKSKKQKEHEYLYWELYEGKPNCAVRYKNWKGIVLDSRQGLNVQLFDLSSDESEKNNLAAEHPDVVAKIKKIMTDSHRPNKYWDKDNQPLFNVQKACKDHGVEMIVKKKKK